MARQDSPKKSEQKTVQKNEPKAKVLVAMSGGVDSSVAALLLKKQGYEVVGVTMKLWGGESDVGCCSVSDVDDARRVADLIDIPHFVFNFGQGFQDEVVDPYVSSYQKGQTPNPCIECNRKIKFHLLTERAKALGFDAVATGHYARISYDESGAWLVRGVDSQKDQSYVLHMLSSEDLTYIMFPIGHLTKDKIRLIAAENNLRIAQKPDSYEVCFIQKGGREKFLAEQISPTPARVLDTEGIEIGITPALEMLTVGQRKGIKIDTGKSYQKNGKHTGLQIQPNYVLSIKPPSMDARDNGRNDERDNDLGTVIVGKKEELLTETQEIRDFDLLLLDILSSDLLSLDTSDMKFWIQTSAHGKLASGALKLLNPSNTRKIEKSPDWLIYWDNPQKRVAPGQSIVFYEDFVFDEGHKSEARVIGSALAK